MSAPRRPRAAGDEPISEAELRAAIRAATIANRVQPVLCGSALRYMGVQPVLDAACDYLPSPLDLPPVTAHSPDGKKEVLLKGVNGVAETAGVTEDGRLPILRDSSRTLWLYDLSTGEEELIYAVTEEIRQEALARQKEAP